MPLLGFHSVGCFPDSMLGNPTWKSCPTIQKVEQLRFNIRNSCCIYKEDPTVGVLTASPEAATSHAKSHVACSGLVSLVVEGRNILRVRKLCHAQSSALEVKNECVERFACESFYLLLVVFICSLVFISSSCFCCCS